MVSRKPTIIEGTTFLIVIIALVVVPVTAAHGVHKTHRSNGPKPCKNVTNTSLKVIQDLCHNTYYQETCINALANATNSTDPKTLIKITFQVAIERLTCAANQIGPLRTTSRDPNAAQAYEICEHYIGNANSDLQTALDKFGSFDVRNPDMFVDNIKSSLTAASTYQQTCLDSFEGAERDVRERMNRLLKEPHELTINGLALVNEFSKPLSVEQKS